MDNKYKVIIPFGIAKKGDEFEYNYGLDLYELNFTDNEIDGDTKIIRNMFVSCDTIDNLCGDGYLVPITESDENVETTVSETLEYIDNLMEQYNSDLQDITSKFNKGEIQPCVKLEAETVYYNLNKVLNSVKEKLIK